MSYSHDINHWISKHDGTDLCYSAKRVGSLDLRLLKRDGEGNGNSTIRRVMSLHTRQ